MKHASAVVILALLAASSASAEPGDYSPVRTLFNLLFPPAADNPVTPEQATGDYPLLVNPPGFDDGFDPARYGVWQAVHLHPDTGATCGNGSEYKFFVNRSPGTSNMVLYSEGGGACWDYETCSGATDLGARNPNGIPDDYLSYQNPAASLVSPFVFRQHPYSKVKTQKWTLVYVPYCTGDIYIGDKIAVYENPDPSGAPLVWHHNGLRNMRAVVAWLKDNLEQPAQTLATGCSAGGAGTIANYFHVRRDLDPQFGFMLDDSGPIFPAVADTGMGTPSPSWPLHQRIRAAWGLDEPPGPGEPTPFEVVQEQLPGFDLEDMGSINGAVADQFPNDRLGQTHFWQDFNYSRYSYERFYDPIKNAPNDAVRALLIHLLWYADTASLGAALGDHDNYGYYIPNVRNLNDSHCSTIVDFENGDIQEQGLELQDFIDDILDGSGPVLQAAETDWHADDNKPFNLLYYLVDRLLEGGP